MQSRTRSLRPSAGLFVWLVSGLLAAALLTFLPLDWGVAYGQTAPSQPVAPPPPVATPEPPPTIGRASPPAVPAPVSEPVIVPLPPDAVSPQFVSFLEARDALAALGRPLSRQTTFAGMVVQYFEKNRVEDHSAFETDPAWRVMYGLLVQELMRERARQPIGGEESTLTYADLARLAEADQRLAPPADFGGGVFEGDAGAVFIPYDPILRPVAGHWVPARFWAFMQRPDVFPGGWLHDLGLPITAPTKAVVRKGALAGREIELQAFQRGIVTFDPANPELWQIELANVGTDFVRTFAVRIFGNGVPL